MEQQSFFPPDPPPVELPPAHAPLAARMRPRTLAEIAGQEELLGPDRLLPRAIAADRLVSLLLCGPPGCGKTTIARVIAQATRRHFVEMSGVTASVQDIRSAGQDAAQLLRRSGRGTLLFIDELHRLNRAQQDVLLPYVENGHFCLIGATTHNPAFFIIAPLLSRSMVFRLEPLTEAVIIELLRRALEDRERGLGRLGVTADPEALAHLAHMAEGDARRALNALELAALTTPPDAAGLIHVTRAAADESIQCKTVLYDRDEDSHYDTISVFIKSMRGSDPDAAIYWLAKMLEAGEDPRFIARRIVIAAAEDVGLADPRALQVAVAAMAAVEYVGMPEAQIPLAEAAIYLATAPKSNSAYRAIAQAREDVQSGSVLPVPVPLRDGNKASRAAWGHGEGYLYPHDFPEGLVPQDYLPEPRSYYQPVERGYEQKIAERLRAWRAYLARWQAAAAEAPPPAPPGEGQ